MAYTRIIRRLHKFGLGVSILGLGVLFVLAVGSATTYAADQFETSVPLELQVPLMFKFIALDRNFAEVLEYGEATFGILYSPNNVKSLALKQELVRVLKGMGGQRLKGVPFSFKELPFDDKAELYDMLYRERIHFLFVIPGHSIGLAHIRSMTSSEKILTIALRPEDVAEGLSIGVIGQTGRPQIIINLASARSEGRDFPARILQMARVIKGK